MEYKLNKNLSNKKYTIIKSSNFDDIFNGTDAIISYKDQQEKNKVWFIDFVISWSERKKKDKNSKADKEKIIYNFMLQHKKDENIKAKRIIESYDPYMTYTLTTEILSRIEKWENFTLNNDQDINKLLEKHNTQLSNHYQHKKDHIKNQNYIEAGHSINNIDKNSIYTKITTKEIKETIKS